MEKYLIDNSQILCQIWHDLIKLTQRNVEVALWREFHVIQLNVRLVGTLSQHLRMMAGDLKAHSIILLPEVDLVDNALAQAMDLYVSHGYASLQYARIVAVAALAKLKGIHRGHIQVADALLEAWRQLLEALFDALVDIGIAGTTGRYIGSCVRRTIEKQSINQ